MGKDLTRRTSITESEQTKTIKQTEVERAQKALAERLLFGVSARPQEIGAPRVILGLDCTTCVHEYVEERRITSEAARDIARSLFDGQPGLQVRLAFFRGDGDAKHPRQLRFSNEWYDAPVELARAIMKVEHWAGWTQHCRLLRHVVEEAEKQAIQRVVIISDAFERQTPRRPDGDDLVAACVHARRLRSLGTTLVYGYKGSISGACPLGRAGIDAEQAFREIAEEGGGYVFLFDPATVVGRFAEIATQAALAAKGDAAGAQKLIEHMQTMPFEMVVDERVPGDRCTAQSEE